MPVNFPIAFAVTKIYPFNIPAINRLDFNLQGDGGDHEIIAIYMN